MKCPICIDVDLVMSERSGVEIDYCPKCRGVWLDRGELDKIIEKNTALSTSAGYETPQPNPQVNRQQPYGYANEKDSYGYGDRYHNDKYYGKRKKKSFLGELFDFD